MSKVDYPNKVLPYWLEYVILPRFTVWRSCQNSEPICRFELTDYCHESGYHSLKLHITHGLHLPSCTALTHSRPPLHQSHSCHHSLISLDCLTTPAPHSLFHLKVAHKHSPIAKSCFPRLTFPSGFPVCLSVYYPGLLTSSPDRLLPASLTSPV